MLAINKTNPITSPGKLEEESNFKDSHIYCCYGLNIQCVPQAHMVTGWSLAGGSWKCWKL
jgi:hypothetical protein